MSLAHRCSESFEWNVRRRGDDYFQEDTVDIIESSVARGVGEILDDLGTFVVEVDWADQADGLMSARCNCDFYSRGRLCKHIWAFIREADYQTVTPRGSGQIDVHCMEMPKTVAKQYRRPSRWKQDLVDVCFGKDERALVSSQKVGSREAYYLIDVGASVKLGQLVLLLRQREMKKDGEWGKLKKLRIDRADIPLFTEKDQHVLQFLLGNDNYEDSYYYQNFNASEGISSCCLSPALFDLVLPNMCGTGRCRWILSSSQSADDGRNVTWDGGKPWSFALEFKENAEEKQWEFEGVLRRNKDVSLRDVVMALPNGLVIVDDRLCRLNASKDDKWIEMLLRENKVNVPFDDRDEFLEAIYQAPHLPQAKLPESLKVVETMGVPAPSFQVKRNLKSRSNSLFGKITFKYDETVVTAQDTRRGICEADKHTVLLRDLEKEGEYVRYLLELGCRPLSENNAFSHPDMDVQFSPKLLSDLTRELLLRDWVVTADGTKVRQAGALQLRVRTELDWFELDGDFDFDGVKATLPELLKAVKKGDGVVQLSDGSEGMLPEEWLKQNGFLFALADTEAGGLRFSTSQAALLDALLACQTHVTVDAKFRQYQEKLMSFNGVAAKEPPATFIGELRDYQKEGLGWLDFLREFGLGGCLADDMGLGKTIQVLGLLDERRTRRKKNGEEDRSPSIVIVPRSLVFNWQREAERFTPNLKILDHTGPDRQTDMTVFSNYDVILTTYGTLRRDIVQLREMRFDYAILDEAQAIKNSSSQASKACRLLQADQRLAMTGTPVENRLEELWSLFEFLNPGMLGRASSFGELTKARTAGDTQVSVLGRALRPYILRRTKSQVLTELPAKTELTIYCEMGTEQRKMYDELREFYRVNLSKTVEEQGLNRSKIHVLEALLRLRQAACHPALVNKDRKDLSSAKMDVLMEHVKEVVAEGHKALVFSQFTSLLALVKDCMDEQGITYEYLDGRTRNREQRVQHFQEDPECKLFLISLKAGGYGLNLTAAEYVFMLDPWWNPAVEAQAIDRVHRIGQEKPVFAYRMICRDTVEEKILELQHEKRQLADAIVSADNNLIRDLTFEDLQLLLS
ncbi:MAG: superfamily II DNA or RNA helicase [Pirellulaceae bacterium]|jgi:superfamily II DNA or RNA helicase